MRLPGQPLLSSDFTSHVKSLLLRRTYWDRLNRAKEHEPHSSRKKKYRYMRANNTSRKHQREN